MLALHYTTWDGTAQVHPLSPGRTRVGRTAENDLQIDELEVSGHHCDIVVDGNRVTVTDARGSCGTFVDGMLVTEADLESGQLLNLGSFSIQVCAVDDDSGRSRGAQKGEGTVPTQLPDGSYSCLRHAARRARWECRDCFGLYCEECWEGKRDASEKVVCPKCQAVLVEIDWSGLERRTEDVLKDLLPEGVRKAVSFWERYQKSADGRD